MTEQTAASDGGRMDLEQIRRYMPHAYPMLLLDRVLEYRSGQNIVALKNITANEPQLPGHYPHRFIYPGVLICESMFQAGALLGLRTLEDTGRMVLSENGLELAGEDEQATGYSLLTKIESIRFKRPVVPGDQLVLKAGLDEFGERRGLIFARMVISSEVDEKVCAFGSYRAVLSLEAPK